VPAVAASITWTKGSPTRSTHRRKRRSGATQR
jgi:hypothetical protein